MLIKKQLAGASNTEAVCVCVCAHACVRAGMLSVTQQDQNPGNLLLRSGSGLPHLSYSAGVTERWSGCEELYLFLCFHPI